MTQLPSVAKLNDFKRRVIPRKASVNNDQACAAFIYQAPSIRQLNLER